MTSGKTYLVTAFESSNSATLATPTLTVTGTPASTLIATNTFSGGAIGNDSTSCYEWAWWFTANTTSTTATVSLGVGGTGRDTSMDVLAITGDDTSAPIVQSNGSESGCHSGFCTTNSETASANLTSAPAAGDVSLEIIASDDNFGTSLTWTPSTGVSTIYFDGTSPSRACTW